jgi:hypothetical protein
MSSFGIAPKKLAKLPAASQEEMKQNFTSIL